MEKRLLQKRGNLGLFKIFSPKDGLFIEFILKLLPFLGCFSNWFREVLESKLVETALFQAKQALEY